MRYLLEKPSIIISVVGNVLFVLKTEKGASA
jgi:hypothetical protein